MFLFVSYYAYIVTKVTQQSVLKVVFQNFQGFKRDNLLILDEHFLQTCEYQCFGGDAKVQKTDSCRHQTDYERYQNLDLWKFPFGFQL